MPEARRALPRLIAFSDTACAEPALLLERFAGLAERALRGSVLFVLRDYELELSARMALGAQLAALAARTGQRFGLADRADLALALGCTAFHLPGSGFSANDARRYLGSGVLLSRGTHDPSQAAEVELDALLLSPIFEARKGRAALGLAALERLARASSGAQPALFALGGVRADNAAACVAAGAQGVAVIGAALAPDPEPLLAALGISQR